MKDLGDQDFVAVSAVRYALGRRTYVVGETCAWLMRHWRGIDTRAQDIIVCDLDEALALDESGDQKIGMECDRHEWKKLRAFIDAEDDRDKEIYASTGKWRSGA